MEPTIYPIYTQMLSRAEREKKLHQQARVIWLFGLSGSGKSTLESWPLPALIYSASYRY